MFHRVQILQNVDFMSLLYIIVTLASLELLVAKKGGLNWKRWIMNRRDQHWRFGGGGQARNRYWSWVPVVKSCLLFLDSCSNLSVQPLSPNMLKNRPITVPAFSSFFPVAIQIARITELLMGLLMPCCYYKPLYSQNVSHFPRTNKLELGKELLRK